MSKEIDFRIICPVRRFDNYLKADTFIIPCNLLEINEAINDKVFKIRIERLDFDTGELINHEAITYKKSIDLFNDLGYKTPFMTECKISKNPKYGIQYLVYGIFNNGGTINLITGELMDANEGLMNEIFKSNYQELREWVKQP